MKGILIEVTVRKFGSGRTFTKNYLFFPDRRNLEIGISQDGKVTVERIPPDVVLKTIGRRTLKTVEVPLAIIKKAEKILEDIEKLNLESWKVSDLLDS